jgi:hypothetical protein
MRNLQEQVPCAVLVVVKQLGFIAFLFVDIVPEGVKGGYIGVVISGGGVGAGWGGKGENGDTGLHVACCSVQLTIYTVKNENGK